MSENNFKLADMVRFRKGQKSKLDTLSLGEPGYTLDTEEFVIGGVSKNVFFSNKDYVDGELEKRDTEINKNNQEIKSVENIAKTSSVTRSRIPDNEIPASKLRTSSQNDRIKLVNLHEEVLDAITGETPINSIPANGSVTPEKLQSDMKNQWDMFMDAFASDGDIW